MLWKDARKDLVELGMMIADSQEDYPEDFLIHVATKIQSNGMDIETVKETMPETKLISEDLKSLIAFEKRTRCYFGCLPISYQYFDAYLEDSSLEVLAEQPYYSSAYSTLEAPFTKTKFLESIEKRKEKQKETTKLIRK